MVQSQNVLQTAQTEVGRLETLQITPSQVPSHALRVDCGFNSPLVGWHLALSVEKIVVIVVVVTTHDVWHTRIQLVV